MWCAMGSPATLTQVAVLLDSKCLLWLLEVQDTETGRATQRGSHTPRAELRQARRLNRARMYQFWGRTVATS